MEPHPVKTGGFFRPRPIENIGLLELVAREYGAHCCGHPHLPALADDGFDDIFADFARQCYEAKGKGKKISRDVYFKTAQKLSDGLMKGLGKDGIGKYDAPQNLLAAKFRQSIFAFSAAKTTSEYRAMAEALTDKDGKLLTFNQFREKVDKINVLYNETWLKTEYDTAVAKAQAAMEWDRFVAEKDKFPYLVYKTQEDGRVRQPHAVLDNIKRPVDDAFWKTYYPPNGWNCRCYAVQDDSQHNITSKYVTRMKGRKSNTPKYFKGNSGQTPVLFDDTHPYYIGKNGKKVEVDGAKDYGLPDYKTVKERAKSYSPAAPKELRKNGFSKWWGDMVKDNGVGGDNFQLQGRDGTDILFSGKQGGQKNRFTREHLISGGHEQSANKIPDILKNADEVWSFTDKKNGKLTNSYIRYYQDKMYVLIAQEDNGAMRCITSYQLEDIKGAETTFDNLRKGTLLHANKFW